MGTRKQLELPASLDRLRDRFSTWRQTRSVGSRIPKPLWKSAAKVAAEHGVNLTASALKLDYYSLKKRVTGDNGLARSSKFVELSSACSPLPIGNECVIDLEDSSGARMRMHLKGSSVPDVLALARDFWNAE